MLKIGYKQLNLDKIVLCRVHYDNQIDVAHLLMNLIQKITHKNQSMIFSALKRMTVLLPLYLKTSSSIPNFVILSSVVLRRKLTLQNISSDIAKRNYTEQFWNLWRRVKWLIKTPCFAWRSALEICKCIT